MQRMVNFRGWALSVQADDDLPGVFVAVCYRDEIPRTHHFAAECGWLAGLLAIRHAREVIARDAGSPAHRAPWNRTYEQTNHFESMKRKLAEIDARKQPVPDEADRGLAKEAV